MFAIPMFAKFARRATTPTAATTKSNATIATNGFTPRVCLTTEVSKDARSASWTCQKGRRKKLQNGNACSVPRSPRERSKLFVVCFLRFFCFFKIAFNSASKCFRQPHRFWSGPALSLTAVHSLKLHLERILQHIAEWYDDPCFDAKWARLSMARRSKAILGGGICVSRRHPRFEWYRCIAFHKDALKMVMESKTLSATGTRS